MEKHIYFTNLWMGKEFLSTLKMKENTKETTVNV